MTPDRERNMKTGVGPACRDFLRALAMHVDQARMPANSTAGAGHAAACNGCAGLLRATVAQVRLLRIRPHVPVALQSRATFEAVLSRAIEELEAAPLGEMLAQAVPLAPVGDAAWPVPCESGSELVRTLAGPGTGVSHQVVPGWVWLRVKDRIRAEAARTAARTRRWRLLRSFGVAAVLLLAALMVLPFARTGGSPAGSGHPEPVIVMQKMPRAPAIDYLPAAVLRHGGG